MGPHVQSDFSVPPTDGACPFPSAYKWTKSIFFLLATGCTQIYLFQFTFFIFYNQYIFIELKLIYNLSYPILRFYTTKFIKRDDFQKLKKNIKSSSRHSFILFFFLDWCFGIFSCSLENDSEKNDQNITFAVKKRKRKFNSVLCLVLHYKHIVTGQLFKFDNNL